MTKAKAPAWPAEAIHSKPLAWFKPFEQNPRLHSKEQVEQIRASMGQFGWTIPMLADESGEVIAGHGRLLAAQLHPPLSHAPVVIAAGWTVAQKRAYRIADNKLTENGGWDDLKLRGEMKALHMDAFDLNLTGFDMGTARDLAGIVDPLTNMPDIPKGDKSPFEQITFTLHTSQVKIVRDAMKAADGMGTYGGSPNDNKNGNAIARVAKEFLKARGKAKGKRK